jgi:pyruvate dehydrogenase E2 component (dihydrolipoamide acetyltransferase)
VPEAAPAAEDEDEVEPLTRMRQAIARRMATAKREIPHYYVAVSVDMTEALAMRRDLNAQLPVGDHISVSHLILKSCALALEHHPHFNATFTETGITVHHHINIGLAVALDDGLVVPAILDCRGKSLGALARASIDVAERARNGRLRPAELNDGTFTVSNLGMYGVETLIAIIQPGQAAILGVGRVEERPVVRDGQIVIRSMMTIALSADHRVTDGAQGAQFVAEIKDLLENPARLVL